jgi:hypothetical protein
MPSRWSGMAVGMDYTRRSCTPSLREGVATNSIAVKCFCCFRGSWRHIEKKSSEAPLWSFWIQAKDEFFNTSPDAQRLARVKKLHPKRKKTSHPEPASGFYKHYSE